ncbi:glycoside hydrolase family 75 protein [Streptomyces sp. NPDC058653]|uniref:glycoside hydrolase family 75 protein n=1 Tax=Streptomyces sp. NPDC058653 TaxID=3346576 RepID=UPI00364E25EE
MHHRSPLYALVGAVLLTASALPATALPASALDTSYPPPPGPQSGAPGPPTDENSPEPDAPVTADALLAKVGGCTPVSEGRYRTDQDRPADVPVCGAKGAVFWKADLDIDCDGQITDRCNRTTDRWFHADTAFHQSDGKPLNAETLPYVVVPAPSEIWDYTSSGIRGGAVAAVLYKDRVEYAVVGDTGPAGIIGEASYAAAQRLGMNPDPSRGGVASGVTYILFKDSRVTPIESRSAVVELGQKLAGTFLREN